MPWGLDLNLGLAGIEIAIKEPDKRNQGPSSQDDGVDIDIQRTVSQFQLVSNHHTPKYKTTPERHLGDE